MAAGAVLARLGIARFDRHVFPLDRRDHSFNGLQQSTGSALPVVEAQGRLLAAVLSGRYRLPEPAQARADAEAELAAARHRWGSRRPHMRIDIDAYLRLARRELAASEGVLQGRRIVITGAAGTFGRALAARFTGAGASDWAGSTR